MDIVFLPATDPFDETYGSAPSRIAGIPDARIRQVRYPTLVWYNKAVRDEAITQIRGWGITSIILVGFSKSGLGAWNIAQTIPEVVSATIIFDSPVARLKLPPWETDAFYANDIEWQEDLPLRQIHAYAAATSEAHRLIIISGANFHDEMRSLSQALTEIRYNHTFLDRSGMKHHWDSGWVAEGLKAALEPTFGNEFEDRDLEIDLL